MAPAPRPRKSVGTACDRDTLGSSDGSKACRLMPSPAQLRAARVMLGLSQAEVAGRACLSVPTVKRAEADAGLRVSDAIRAAITVVLKKRRYRVHEWQRTGCEAEAAAAL